MFIIIAIVIRPPVSATPPVSLTDDTLQRHLIELAQRNNAKNYVISSPLHLRDDWGAKFSWYLNDLTFEPGGVIYTRGAELSLSIRGRLTVKEPGQIIFQAFPEGERTAQPGRSAIQVGAQGQNGRRDGEDGAKGGPGTDGEPGHDGRSGGRLVLKMERVPTARFAINLVGQNGGAGGNGAQGGRGGDGARGDTAKSGLFDCSRGGGKGGDGGDGGRGGSGGAGGACGDGGELLLLAPVAIIDRFEELVDFDRSIAENGPPGQPGLGGGPGKGGRGGHGSGHCRGGKGGSPGRKGLNGEQPKPAAKLCQPAKLSPLETGG